jgi:hypothetical protein
MKHKILFLYILIMCGGFLHAATSEKMGYKNENQTSPKCGCFGHCSQNGGMMKAMLTE